MKDFLFKSFEEMTEKDYETVGFKSGLEIHQQLFTTKNFSAVALPENIASVMMRKYCAICVQPFLNWVNMTVRVDGIQNKERYSLQNQP